ncbi:hypothetical protein ACQE3E_07845 [Methylomonas sp. MED-D]|uniref:hypothetical protein n=1 Tax=unclassified Methylomonas TaxID=2608980 RepID=UPI003CE70018
MVVFGGDGVALGVEGAGRPIRGVVFETDTVAVGVGDFDHVAGGVVDGAGGVAGRVALGDGPVEVVVFGDLLLQQAVIALGIEAGQAGAD